MSRGCPTVDLDGRPPRHRIIVFPHHEGAAEAAAHLSAAARFDRVLLRPDVGFAGGEYVLPTHDETGRWNAAGPAIARRAAKVGLLTAIRPVIPAPSVAGRRAWLPALRVAVGVQPPMADTMQAALREAGLGGSTPPSRPPRDQGPSILPPRREVSRRLDPSLRLELKAALIRRDLSGVVRVSRHAVERFRERFEPDSSHKQARLSLTARAGRGSWHSARPLWVSFEREAGYYTPLENVGFIIEGEGDDEIVLPLALTAGGAEPMSAVTCLFPTPPKGSSW